MRKHILASLVLALSILFAEDIVMYAQSQVDGTQADRTQRRVGIHRGNQVRTVFGNWGVIGQPHGQGPMAAWRHDGDGYVGDISPMVGAEVVIERKDNDGNLVLDDDGNVIIDTVQHVVVTPAFRPGSNIPGEQEEGRAWTFEPIRGFFNPQLEEPGKGVAMNHQPETWPDFWPDQPDYVDSVGNVVWNSFFGPGESKADQESYFWMSDHHDRELLRRYEFRPDSTRLNRGGMGFDVAVRGMQWANILAEDNIFWLYDIHNSGTTNYRRTVFGILVGMWVGGGQGVGGEWEDNVSFFDVEEDITYAWKFNFREPTQNPRWVGPVGIVGVAFLESPGNPFDGIDNDGNVEWEDAPRFQQADFGPPPDRDFTRTVNFNPNRYSPDNNGCEFVGDNPRFPDNYVVLINDTTRYYRMSDEPILVYDRELVCLDKLAYEKGKTSNDTLTVESLGVEYKLWNGKELVEEVNTGIDENLNGLIDENYSLHYEQIRRNEQGQILFRITRPLAYRNYFTGEGLDVPLIDERRDDGVDNFLGVDTDPRESDQIGLTSFEYFTPADLIDMTDKQDLWARMTPGFFDVPDMFRYDEETGENVPLRGEDGNYVYASGYFPLGARSNQRMSVALVYGQNFDQLFHNKNTVQDIYDASYQFPQPPTKPTLTAVPDDGKVTLIWDDVAEDSYNPVLELFYPDEPERARDFQGYKLYRSKDPDFRDIRTITDGRGNPRFYDPLVQYDKINNITGFFNASPSLTERLAGAQFWLGNDSGLQHRYVDTDVKNGVTYYYALVAYNHGSEEFDVFPSENTRFIHKDVTGEVVTDINTAVVVPNAPTAGYVPPEGAGELEQVAGPATGSVYSVIINPRDIKDNHRYRVEFTDTALTRSTLSYHVYDVTNRESPDTLLYNEREFTGETRFFDGLQLGFDNHWETTYSDSLSGWKGDVEWEDMNFRMAVFDAMVRGQRVRGVRTPADYEIEFFDHPVDTSVVHPVLGGTEQPLPFQVRNVTDGTEPKVRYSDVTDQISRSIALILIEEIDGEDRITWRIPLTGSPSMELPGSGYTLSLRTLKPFTSRDAFEFTTVAEHHDDEVAKDKLEDIRVVPNPYVATAEWEQPLPPGVISGRGERKIDFINVPEGSKIDIFTSRGAHVITLYHEGGITDGAVSWNLRTKENLEVAFGVYFYVVDAPDIGQKFGRIALIK